MWHKAADMAHMHKAKCLLANSMGFKQVQSHQQHTHSSLSPCCAILPLQLASLCPLDEQVEALLKGPFSTAGSVAITLVVGLPGSEQVGKIRQRGEGAHMLVPLMHVLIVCGSSNG